VSAANGVVATGPARYVQKFEYLRIANELLPRLIWAA
jgi:hypothetical protein